MSVAVREPEVVAVFYEYRRVSKETGRSGLGWSKYIEDPPVSSWTEDEEIEIRNVRELVYAEDDPKEADAYEAEYYSSEYDEWLTNYFITDVRNADHLRDVRPLVSKD